MTSKMARLMWALLISLPLAAAADMEVKGKAGGDVTMATGKTTLDDYTKIVWEKIDNGKILTYSKTGSESSKKSESAGPAAATAATAPAPAPAPAPAQAMISSPDNSTADTWERTEGALYKEKKFVFDQTRGDLTIIQLGLTDKGKYKVTMTPKAGTAEEKTFTVIVTARGGQRCSLSLPLMAICSVSLMWWF